ncbi:MAG: carboxypeptidase regulatory-like domain-containing protein [Patescibacteria group bacterium]|jgi:hypothetical protein
MHLTFDNSDDNQEAQANDQKAASAEEKDDQPDQSNSKHKVKPSNVELKISFNRKIVISVLVTIILIVAGFCVWQFDLFTKFSNWYNAAQVSVRVMEKDTNKPLAGAVVMIDSVSATTNSDGVANMSGLISGKITVTATKTDYSPQTFDATLYRGLNPLPDIILEKAPDKTFSLTGTVVDYVSGKGIAEAKLLAGTVAGDTDASGAFTLMIKADVTQIKVTKTGYIDWQQSFTIKSDKTFGAIKAEMQPKLSVIFEQEKGGKIDLLTTDVTGATPKNLFSDKYTGSNTAPLLSPNQKTLAFLSDRDGVVQSGQAATKLYLKDTAGNITKATDDNDPKYIRWASNNTIVYVYTSSASPSQTAIMAYRTDTKARIQLNVLPATSTNILTSIVTMSVSSDGGTVVYTQDAYGVADGTPGLSDAKGIFSVKIDGSNLRRISNAEINSGQDLYFLTSTSVRYSYRDSSYNYKTLDINLSNTTPNQTDSTATPTVRDRIYTRTIYDPGSLDSVTLKTSSGRWVYIDTRNGQTDVFVADSNGKNETQLTSTGSAASIMLTPDQNYVIVGTSLNGAKTTNIVGIAGGAVRKIVETNSNQVGVVGS